MAPRSTRNKIRFQSKKALTDINNCMQHYMNMEEINEHKSPVVNINLPPLVNLLIEVEYLMKQFDKML